LIASSTPPKITPAKQQLIIPIPPTKLTGLTSLVGVAGEALILRPRLLNCLASTCQLCFSGDGTPTLSVGTIERRPSGLGWHYQQRGFTLDRKDRHIATVLAGIKRLHGRPRVQKEAVLTEDILDMIATPSFGLRDQRNRTIVLVGYADGLPCSEIVSLDINCDNIGNTDRATEGNDWIAIEDHGLILTFRGKTGWREVEIGPDFSDQTCPVHALEQYLHFPRLTLSLSFKVSRVMIARPPVIGCLISM
jgi:hypothetical protein